jgi:hypothetical protein
MAFPFLVFVLCNKFMKEQIKNSNFQFIFLFLKFHFYHFNPLCLFSCQISHFQSIGIK